MIKIKDAFQNKKAFITFLTAGDPDFETSVKNFKAAAEAGADLIEVGIPFSDPIAEGPVIQEADVRALAGKMTTDRAFELVRELRKTVRSTPIVFMTYANPVYHYGLENFFKNAAEAGAQGIIIPDVPFEEKGEFVEAADKYEQDFISMIAPTSDERIKMIASEARGFIYVVSSMGVTGTRSDGQFDSHLSRILDMIKDVTDVPAAVGFGISTPDQAEKMALAADGVIVGSAMVKIAAREGKDAPEKLAEYVKSMKEAVNKSYNRS